MEIKVTLQNLLQELNQQGLLSNTKFQAIQSTQAQLWTPVSSPWYIRLLMVFGAWIASLFFLAAIFIAGLVKSEESAFVLGIVWIIIATVLCRFSKQFFLTQLALSLSIVGHLCVFISVSKDFRNFSATAICAIVLAIVLYWPYKDSLHRFLSPLSALGVIILWIYSEKLYPVFHLLLLFEVFGTAILFTDSRVKSIFRPLAYACSVAIPLTLLLVLLGEPKFLGFSYQNVVNADWLIAKVIFAMALIWLYKWVAGGLSELKREPLRFGVSFTLLLGFISTPGILATLWLMILGYALRNRILIGLAITFLPIFISLYYYSLDLTLDIKAYILLISGLVFLIMRWYLSRFREEEKEKLGIFTFNPPNLHSHALWSTVAVLILVLFVVNGMIWQKQNVLASGKAVLLKLAPLDPRSLIQGDYMRLDYALYTQFNREQLKDLPRDGRIVVKLDENGVATFLRFYQGGNLASDEQLLRYYVKENRYSPRMQLGAESFFFQEGHARYYGLARYGELKVDANGNSVFVGLRGEKFDPLGPRE